MKFLIMDAPSEGNLPLYLKELEKNHVTNLVRVCEPTYSKEPVEQQHIKVHVSGPKALFLLLSMQESFFFGDSDSRIGMLMYRTGCFQMVKPLLFKWFKIGLLS